MAPLSCTNSSRGSTKKPQAYIATRDHRCIARTSGRPVRRLRSRSLLHCLRPSNSASLILKVLTLVAHFPLAGKRWFCGTCTDAIYILTGSFVNHFLEKSIQFGCSKSALRSPAYTAQTLNLVFYVTTVLGTKSTSPSGIPMVLASTRCAHTILSKPRQYLSS